MATSTSCGLSILNKELASAHANAVNQINRILRDPMYGRIHDSTPLEQLAMELVLYIHGETVDWDIAFNMEQRILRRCDGERKAKLMHDAEDTLKIMGAI